MTLTPEQLEMRRKGATATDVAALSGFHPYRSPVDVWEEKTGRAPLFVDTTKTKWGNLLEPTVRADYAERHGVHVELHGTLVHPDNPRHMATPDGLVFEGAVLEPCRGLEVKCHTIHERWRYGAPYTDEVPLYELVQCAWNMHVAKLPRWDLVLFADNEPTDYIIPSDAEFQASLVEIADRFWVDHVLADVRPDPDGSDSWTEHVKRRFPKDKDPAFIDADEAIRATVAALREARDGIRIAERTEAALVQAIKEYIGDRAGVRFPGAAGATEAITWKKAADSRGTDWKAVATALGAQSGLLAEAARSLQPLLQVLSTWDQTAQIWGHSKEDGKIATGPAVDALRAVIDLATTGPAPDSIAAKYATTKTGSRRFVVPTTWRAGDSKEG